MAMSLDGCDFNDFLMRWRFLSIREGKDGAKMVLFTPHSGSTVFFGNLNVHCTESDIYDDLCAANVEWKHSSVRLKLGKGFAYAFVDFPTRSDALAAVKHFDGTQAFKSKYVSADIEAIQQRGDRRHHHKHNGNGRNQNGRNQNGNGQRVNGRNRSYSNPASSSHYGRGHHHPRNGMGNNGNGTVAEMDSKASLKTTVYLGNLRDDVTKQDIQSELAKFDDEWKGLTIRLNLRSGWSHAFVDFAEENAARKLIQSWNNRPSALTATRLRCEVSKRQM